MTLFFLIMRKIYHDSNKSAAFYTAPLAVANEKMLSCSVGEERHMNAAELQDETNDRNGYGELTKE